ncbi:MAG TPA: GntR family transcriptional regulator [Lacisediminihabitans sp.]|uniref:GntR family transcriptional regulator n=1 Tax=Lacisediminihabitans sp. TaxID=2787631 RepID=UPI002ED94F9D
MSDAQAHDDFSPDDEPVDAGPSPGKTTPAQPDTPASSVVVTTVFEQILREIHQGTLLPGERISDSELAAQLGVSRTPVREALQRLREIGLVEASPNRFTRVAIISPRQTANAMVVWLALYEALVREVVATAPADVATAMSADHHNFLEQVGRLNMQGVATANAEFFDHLVRLSTNPTLQRAITSVVHLIRLGSLHLPDYIDFATLAESQALLLAAVRDRDSAAGLGALRRLSRLEVPIERSEH